jgi:hypothetical protein
MHRSVDAESYKYIIAIFFGIAAIGSMANGVLALPLMTIFAILTSQKRIRIFILLILSIVMLWLYFYGYEAPSQHGSLISAIKENPVGLFEYIFLYLGGPFYFIFGKGAIGKGISLFMGFILISASAYKLTHLTTATQKKSLDLALLTFILYIGGTALGTAGGRLIFGTDQALSSRYTTPAIMAWAAIIVIYSAPIVRSLNDNKNRYLLGMGLLLLPMILLQFSILGVRDDTLFDRKIATLALELQVNDAPQIKKTYPNILEISKIAKMASDRKISVFGVFPLRDLNQSIGKKFPKASSRNCQGYLDDVEIIKDEPRYLRVRGWLFDPNENIVPGGARIISQSGFLSGYLLTGQIRNDVVHAVNKSAIYSGFRGYLLADQIGTSVSIQTEKSKCNIEFLVPNMIYSQLTGGPLEGKSVASESAVLPNNEWIGSDYDKSKFDGARVYGSYIRGDLDIGSITLKVKRGDQIYYRSGPNVDHQTIEVVGDHSMPMKLPLSRDWSLLSFANANLPQRDFFIKLSDSGTGWGEWSAIAVMKNSIKTTSYKK